MTYVQTMSLPNTNEPTYIADQHHHHLKDYAFYSLKKKEYSSVINPSNSLLTNSVVANKALNVQAPSKADIYQSIICLACK